jgi:hypothetical protein
MEILESENAKLRASLEEKHEEIMAQLPAKITQNILENVNVQGVQQLSKNDFMQMFEEQFRRLGTFKESQSAVAITNATDTHSHTGHRFWNWGGKLRPVPEEWLMPTGTVKAICDLFFSGQPLNDIRPFRFISTSDLPRKSQSMFAKAQYVFNFMKNWTISKNLVATDQEFRALSSSRWDEIFEIIYTEIIQTLNAHRANPIRNAGEIKYCTLYDMLLLLKRLP